MPAALQSRLREIKAGIANGSISVDPASYLELFQCRGVRVGKRPGQWIERLAIERGRSGGRSEVDGAAVHAGALGGEAYASWRPLIATAIFGQPIWESG